MLIINHNFHDYYDSVLSLGIDKTIVYDRSPVELIVSKNALVKEISDNIPDRIYAYTDTGRFTYEAYPLIVGVAGKCYLGYRMELEVYGRYNSSRKVEYVYCSEDIENVLDKYDKKESLETFLKPKERSGYKPWRMGSLPFRKFATDPAFDYIRDLNLDMIFREHKTPVFVIEFGARESKLLINPILKNYKFQTVIDPFTAFQEISMYISGVLGVGEPVTVKISDKEMAKKKGFDSKSFKKRNFKKRKL